MIVDLRQDLKCSPDWSGILFYIAQTGFELIEVCLPLPLYLAFICFYYFIVELKYS